MIILRVWSVEILIETCTYPALQELACCPTNWYCSASFTSWTNKLPYWEELPYQMSLTLFSVWILCFISCSLAFSILSTVPASWDMHGAALEMQTFSLANQVVFCFVPLCFVFDSRAHSSFLRLLLLPHLLLNYQDCVPKGSQWSLKLNTWAF